jgi:UMF1 family MFS transporter
VLSCSQKQGVGLKENDVSLIAISRAGYALRKRTVIAWFIYDFGASAFTTSVITVFFGPHITSLAKSSADASGGIELFGIAIHAGSFYPYIISISVLFQVCLLPVLGAIADYSGRKRELLLLGGLMGAGAICAMYFNTGGSYLFDGFLFVVSNVAFGAANVFYNSFLPEICPPEDRNSVSSYGWGMGYLGGGLLLALQYLFLEGASDWEITGDEAVRICLLTSGLWWGICTVTATLMLKTSKNPTQIIKTTVVMSGIKQLASTAREVRHYPQTLLFLVAFLLYSDGIQTITSIATQFGQEEVGLKVSQLAEVVLIVQLVGLGGAFVFNWLARHLGTKQAIMAALVLYSLIALYAYSLLSTVVEFYAMAACISIVLVGSQALSRSAYSQMVPKGSAAEYFAIYEVGQRGTSWIGPLLFGLALQFTGSYRDAILALVVLFLAGLGVLSRVDFARAGAEANAEVAS